MSSLRLRDVTVDYRGRVALSSVDLVCRCGHVTALIGPNGSGKSSLLRAIAGLVHATGSIRLGDEKLLTMPPARRARRVAFLPQDTPAATSLLAIEAVVATIKVVLPEMPGREIERRAVAALSRLGIVDLAFRELGHLSGGQRQLAAMAQVIAQGSPIALLDEPTGALDLASQHEVMTVIRAMAQDGAAILVVLHDLGLAARWADHVVVLDRGRVHAADAPERAITRDVLAAVYGVVARVEPDDTARLRIVVEHPLTTASAPRQRRERS